jgi:hypothetical protein
MIQFASTDNVTWDYLPIGYWSAVETHVGVIVACLPAIRQLQRSIRDKLFPTPPTTSSYYQNNTGETIGSNKKNGSKVSKSRTWLQKTDRSQLSTLGLSKTDKEDFVRLDEYEMGLGAGTVIEERKPAGTSSDRSLDRSFQSNEDTLSLASAASPVGSPTLGGIMVQSEYSVDRARTNRGQPQMSPDQQRTLMDTQKWL